MHFQWPTIEYRDETMREGMQIESADISVDNKVRLLNALGETGLPRIVVGSFVSPPSHQPLTGKSMWRRL